MAKTAAQLDREIAAVTTPTAAPHVKAINNAIYHTRDNDELIAAVRAAKRYVAAMKRVGSGHIDASGAFDPAMYELKNLLVKANEMVRRIKIQRKTGRMPTPSSHTAWKLR